MLDYPTYRLLHFVGLMLLFFSLGATTMQALAGSEAGKVQRILTASTHGVGLLIVLVAGFGALARLQIAVASAPWVWGKLAIWVLLAAAPALIKRKPKLGLAVWFVLPTLGVVAGVLANQKPWGH